MDNEASILKAAKSFFAGTLLSRVMGMVRDISMAFCFGSAPEVAAFMVAYRLANLFRRLFGEGSLQGGFIPHFEKLKGEGGARAALFYREMKASLALVLGAAIALSSLCCWGLALCFESDIPWMALAMMPGVAFLCLYALDSSVLQCDRRYFLPALAPVLFNLVWIVSAYALRGVALREAMFALSFCIMLAFAMQWLAVAREARRRFSGIGSGEKPVLFSLQVCSLLKPLAFGILGVGAAQINSALDALFARMADPSGPAYLWYAIRIQQLPLALVGIAFSGALLPALSRAGPERFGSLLRDGLNKCAALMIPCSVAMAALARPGLDLLYGRGHFLESDLSQTSLCLFGYAIGLLPMVYVLLLANSFYAQKEYRWPMRCSLISVGCNILLNALFVFVLRLGAEGIAVATSLSAYLNCALLAKSSVCGKGLFFGAWRIALSSLAAAGAVLLFEAAWEPQRVFVSQLLRFGCCGSLYVLILLGFSYVLKARDLFEMLRPALKRSAPNEEQS